MRVPLLGGRSRPDLAALLSFDNGHPLTVARAYSAGKVGSFTIGESRNAAREPLSAFPLLDQDMGQLIGEASSWTVALPARSGGYNVYTLKFVRDRLSSVYVFYSVFAGL